MRKRLFANLLLAALAIAGISAAALLGPWGPSPAETAPAPAAMVSARPCLTVYTTGQVTTPQMPLWKALADGDLHFTPEVHFWKSLDDLRGLLLAGKGDIWIGHIDGFAQAARLGAPVRLVAVTGWRKFHILTSRPGIRTVDDIRNLPADTEIAAAPAESPGVAVLRALEKQGFPHLAYAPHAPRQLALRAIQGSEDLILVPEPMATVLLSKAPALREVACVEDIYGLLAGREPLLPIAGIAVNTDILARHPGFADELARALRAQEAPLLADPAEGLMALPDLFEKFLPRDLALQSLQRDVIRVRTAAEARDDVLGYLDMVYPPANGSSSDWGTLPASFFGDAS